MSNFKPMTSQEAHDLLYGKYEMEDDSDPMIRPYSKEEGWVVQMGEDSYTNDMPNAPYEDAKLLAHAERALRTIMEMGKKLTTANDARKAHELLDELDALGELSQEQEKLLRSFLPELPKQKTLKEIQEEVYNTWLNTHDNEWNSEINGGAKDWLNEIGTQLEGIKDAPVNTPALPEGMRLAEHDEYGRCVVSPATNGNGECLIFVLTRVNESGASWGYVEHGSLTFIDTEPAKTAHPVFLETREDYASAPEGTVIAADSGFAYIRASQNVWSRTGAEGEFSFLMPGAVRRVLRWGWVGKHE